MNATCLDWESAEQSKCTNWDNYQHAVHLYALGFSLIPVNRKTKVPVVAWKRYQTERCIYGDLLAWFGVADHAIGIVTGRLSGIVVVDCDGWDAVDCFIEHVGRNESTVRQSTSNGGCHFIYRWDEQNETRNTVHKLCGHVDVRGEGGYVRAYEQSKTWAGVANAPVYDKSFVGM